MIDCLRRVEQPNNGYYFWLANLIIVHELERRLPVAISSLDLLQTAKRLSVGRCLRLHYRPALQDRLGAFSHSALRLSSGPPHPGTQLHPAAASHLQLQPVHLMSALTHPLLSAQEAPLPLSSAALQCHHRHLTHQIGTQGG